MALRFKSLGLVLGILVLALEGFHVFFFPSLWAALALSVHAFLLVLLLLGWLARWIAVGMEGVDMMILVYLSWEMTTLN
jgi:hypothetical protein